MKIILFILFSMPMIGYSQSKGELSGQVLRYQGNFMPAPKGTGIDGTIKTVGKTKVYLYQPPLFQSELGEGGPLFTFPSRDPEYTCKTDRHGKYHFKAKAGNYSLAVVEDGKLFVAHYTGEGVVDQIKIDSGKTQVRNIEINYQAVY